MEKLIIENKSDLTLEKALEYALKVVKQGKISNNGKQHCYLTAFESNKINVATFLNKKSERFVIYKRNY